MSPLTRLTPRQWEIAHLVADGLSNKDIADRLHISVYTVKTTLHSMFHKVDVQSRAELAAMVSVEGVLVRTSAEVGEMIRKSLARLKSEPEPKWGSADWYRREGAIAVLQSLVNQIGEVH